MLREVSSKPKIVTPQQPQRKYHFGGHIPFDMPRVSDVAEGDTPETRNAWEKRPAIPRSDGKDDLDRLAETLAAEKVVLPLAQQPQGGDSPRVSKPLGAETGMFLNGLLYYCPPAVYSEAMQRQLVGVPVLSSIQFVVPHRVRVQRVT